MAIEVGMVVEMHRYSWIMIMVGVQKGEVWHGTKGEITVRWVQGALLPLAADGQGAVMLSVCCQTSSWRGFVSLSPNVGAEEVQHPHD